MYMCIHVCVDGRVRKYSNAVSDLCMQDAGSNLLGVQRLVEQLECKL